MLVGLRVRRSSLDDTPHGYGSGGVRVCPHSRADRLDLAGWTSRRAFPSGPQTATRRRSAPRRSPRPRDRRPSPARLRPRERGRAGADPRLLRGRLGVRAPHLPHPVRPGWDRARELQPRLLPLGPRPLRRAHHAQAAPGPQEEPEAAQASRPLPGPPDQAPVRAGLPGSAPEVRTDRPRGRAQRRGGTVHPAPSSSRLRRSGRTPRCGGRPRVGAAVRGARRPVRRARTVRRPRPPGSAVSRRGSRPRSCPRHRGRHRHGDDGAETTG